MSGIFSERFDNGLVLVAEAHDSPSLALTWLAPGGTAYQRAEMQAPAPLLAELMTRGAGAWDARAHSEALDHLGVQRSVDLDSQHLRLNAVMLASRFAEGLGLLAAMLISPRLEERDLEPARDLAMQAIEALEDEPADRVFTELRRAHFDEPWGRSSLGEAEHVGSVTLEEVRGHWARTCVPEGSILGVAGRFDWDELRRMVERETRGWSGAMPELDATQPAGGGVRHLRADSSQCHIGLAFDALPADHRDSLALRVGAWALSGGTSGRLFTEVRERRGLCYAVHASYAATRGRGYVLCYAGTTPARASETLEVLVRELDRWGRGVSRDEFRRARVGMKAHLVMQGESTAARAHAVAAEQYVLGAPRTLERLSGLLDDMELEEVNRVLTGASLRPMTLVTVGPEALAAAGMAAGAPGMA